MTRRRRPIDLEAYRRGLDSTGEVRVGAYARRQRRRRALLALFGAALIVGAVGLYWALCPKAEETEETYPVKVECISCDYSGTLEVPFGQTFPLTCPVCGEKGCKELWKCRACAHQFLPEPSTGEKQCPACGSQSVGTAAVP